MLQTEESFKIAQWYQKETSLSILYQLTIAWSNKKKRFSISWKWAKQF